MSRLLSSLKNFASGGSGSKSTGEDTNMRFSMSPSPGDSGYSQWLDAMKMVARLPGGIPPEFRKRLWITLAERHLQNKGVNWAQAERSCFNEWSNPDDNELGVQIVKDLHRTGCSLFCGSAGQENQARLKRVLLAYARWNKAVGYCQGFNMLAALILQVMDRSETDSVKVMIYLIEGVLPESYFANNLRGLSVDMAVFRDLLRIRLPRLSRHLEALQNEAHEGTSYEPPLTNVFTMQWFLTLFCNCLPQITVLRVWDLIFLEGNEILLRTALAIWDGLADRILAVNSADEFYSIMGVLTREMLEFGHMDPNILIKSIDSIQVCNELPELRDKYLYNITPWTQTVQSAAKKGFRLFYSDDDEVDSDNDEKMAVATAYGLNVKNRRDSERRHSSAGTIPYIYGHPDREKLALDISVLKHQYAKLRERQRQAHIILTAACARQPMNHAPSASPVAMNHLLIGKSALVSVKGRRLGPPQGAIPPSRQAPVKTHSPSVSTSRKECETLHWKDATKTKRRQSIQSIHVSDEANGNINTLCSETNDKSESSSSYSEDEDGIEDNDDASSTSTELCDEIEKVSDLDVEEVVDATVGTKTDIKMNDVSQKQVISRENVSKISEEAVKTSIEGDVCETETAVIPPILELSEATKIDSRRESEINITGTGDNLSVTESVSSIKDNDVDNVDSSTLNFNSSILDATLDFTNSVSNLNQSDIIISDERLNDAYSKISTTEASDKSQTDENLTTNDSLMHIDDLLTFEVKENTTFNGSKEEEDSNYDISLQSFTSPKIDNYSNNTSPINVSPTDPDFKIYNSDSDLNINARLQETKSDAEQEKTDNNLESRETLPESGTTPVYLKLTQNITCEDNQTGTVEEFSWTTFALKTDFSSQITPEEIQQIIEKSPTTPFDFEKFMRERIYSNSQKEDKSPESDLSGNKIDEQPKITFDFEKFLEERITFLKQSSIDSLSSTKATIDSLEWKTPSLEESSPNIKSPENLSNEEPLKLILTRSISTEKSDQKLEDTEYSIKYTLNDMKSTSDELYKHDRMQNGVDNINICDEKTGDIYEVEKQSKICNFDKIATPDNSEFKFMDTNYDKNDVQLVKDENKVFGENEFSSEQAFEDQKTMTELDSKLKYSFDDDNLISTSNLPSYEMSDKENGFLIKSDDNPELSNKTVDKLEESSLNNINADKSPLEDHKYSIKYTYSDEKISDPADLTLTDYTINTYNVDESRIAFREKFDAILKENEYSIKYKYEVQSIQDPSSTFFIKYGKENTIVSPEKPDELLDSNVYFVKYKYEDQQLTAEQQSPAELNYQFDDQKSICDTKISPINLSYKFLEQKSPIDSKQQSPIDLNYKFESTKSGDIKQESPIDLNYKFIDKNVKTDVKSESPTDSYKFSNQKSILDSKQSPVDLNYKLDDYQLDQKLIDDKKQESPIDLNYKFVDKNVKTDVKSESPTDSYKFNNQKSILDSKQQSPVDLNYKLEQKLVDDMKQESPIDLNYTFVDKNVKTDVKSESPTDSYKFNNQKSILVSKQQSPVDFNYKHEQKLVDDMKQRSPIDLNYTFDDKKIKTDVKSESSTDYSYEFGDQKLVLDSKQKSPVDLNYKYECQKSKDHTKQESSIDLNYTFVDKKLTTDLKSESPMDSSYKFTDQQSPVDLNYKFDGQKVANNIKESPISDRQTKLCAEQSPIGLNYRFNIQSVQATQLSPVDTNFKFKDSDINYKTETETSTSSNENLLSKHSSYVSQFSFKDHSPESVSYRDYVVDDYERDKTKSSLESDMDYKDQDHSRSIFKTQTEISKPEVFKNVESDKKITRNSSCEKLDDVFESADYSKYTYKIENLSSESINQNEKLSSSSYEIDDKLNETGENTHRIFEKQISLDSINQTHDPRLESGRRNSEMALKIIQENSLILHRILQCQTKSVDVVEEEKNGLTSPETNVAQSELFSSHSRANSHEKRMKDNLHLDLRKDTEVSKVDESYSSFQIKHEDSDEWIKKYQSLRQESNNDALQDSSDKELRKLDVRSSKYMKEEYSEDDPPLKVELESISSRSDFDNNLTPLYFTHCESSKYLTEVPQDPAPSLQKSPSTKLQSFVDSPVSNQITKSPSVSKSQFARLQFSPLSPTRKKSLTSPDKFCPFPVSPISRQPKDVGLKLGLYKDLSPIKSPSK